MKTKKFKIITIIGILLATVFLVYAAVSYKIDSGATVTVDEHGTCKKVTNNNALAIFVPTNTAGEWSAFRSYAPSVSLGDCTVSVSIEWFSYYEKVTDQYILGTSEPSGTESMRYEFTLVSVTKTLDNSGVDQTSTISSRWSSVSDSLVRDSYMSFPRSDWLTSPITTDEAGSNTYQATIDIKIYVTIDGVEYVGFSDPSYIVSISA